MTQTATLQPKLIDTLKTRSDFQAVRSGKRFVTDNFILQAKKPDPSINEVRVGYTITKKVGNAVVRNRIRRRLKHAVAQSIFQTAPDKVARLNDLVLVAKRGVLTTSYATLLEELTKGIDRLASKGNKAS